jgi:hypothetical protein
MTRAPDSSSQQETLNAPLRTSAGPPSPNGTPGSSGARSPFAGTDSPTISSVATNEMNAPHNAGQSPEANREGSPPEPAPNGAKSSFWKVLQNQNFLFLWAGQVFSQLADKVYLVLMIALITTQFQSEGQTVSGWVSSVMVAFTIPAVLFGSFAGVLVDRWSKKWTMVLTNVLRGGLVMLLPLLLWNFSGFDADSVFCPRRAIYDSAHCR